MLKICVLLGGRAEVSGPTPRNTQATSQASSGWRGCRSKTTRYLSLPFLRYLGNICTLLYVTLISHKCGILTRLGQRLSSLTHRHRTHILLPVRYQYGSWTQDLSHDPPHACGTPDPPRVATLHHHCGRACPTGADYLTRTYRREAAIRRHLSCCASFGFPYLLLALALLL